MNEQFEEEFEEEEFQFITMIDEDGTEIEFVIMDKVELKGKNYLLVVENEMIDNEETEAIILKEASSDEEDITYEVLEDDDEFDLIAELFAAKGGDYAVEIDD